MAAQLPAPDAEGVVFLIDLSGYVYRAYHALPPLSSAKGEPTHAVMGAVTMLQKVVNERKPSMLAVAMDSKAPSFRKAIDPRYKATRPPAPPDLSGQMARCEQIVRAYNIPIYDKPGLEADDLIAAFVARATADGVRVVIVSADKDLMQLIHDEDDSVLMWDSMRDKVYGAAEVQEKLGVRPSQVRDYLSLTGDTSDNVPGVPSVGPKTASDLLREFGTLEGVYQNLDKIKRPKLRENLTNFEADARLSQKLVTLDASVDVPWDREHLRYGGRDEAELRRLFGELEFTRLLSQLPAPRVQKRTTSTIATRAELEAFAARSREKKTLGLDLRASDVDPNRAAIIGLALSTMPGEGVYAPISHRYLGAPPQVSLRDVHEVLGPLLASADVKKIAHDMKTQEVLLARHDIALGENVFDTGIAGYLLDPETPHTLAALARRELDVVLGGADEPAPASAAPAKASKRTRVLPFDEIDVPSATRVAAPAAEACVSIAERLAPRLVSDGLAKLYDEIEIPLSRVLAHMELAGVLVDVACLERIGKRVEQELGAIEGRTKEAAGRDFAIRSRDQLEQILFDELKLPVLKRTPKGGRSTDAEVLEELAEKHPLPKLLLEFREMDKLKGTYIDALPRYVNPKTGRIHTRFTQTVAATGRLASSDPNLQNIPIRSELGQEIRSAFVAPPGCVLVSADYSQIELRVLAHLSQDAMLVEAYRKADDVHTLTASVVFGVDRAEVTTDMRRQAKTINFGVIYGMGDSALGRQLGIPREQAARFIEAYFTRYEGVARFMERTVEAARRGEAVRTMLGRRRFLPNLHSANRGLRFEAERIAKNTPIQGTAADILKLAMVKLGRGEVVPGARMVLTVHDELVFEVPEDRAAEASRVVKEAMETALPLDVPLVVEVGSGKNWAAAH
ncbi:MAG TPA: DNA polymerase I [Polyangiaceae bacterium]|nr:DNA polymerase I [Polyangiaceae bacterium]